MYVYIQTEWKYQKNTWQGWNYRTNMIGIKVVVRSYNRKNRRNSHKRLLVVDVRKILHGSHEKDCKIIYPFIYDGWFKGLQLWME